MAENAAAESKIMLNEILQKMEAGFGAVEREMRSMRTEMQTGFRAAAEDRQAIRLEMYERFAQQDEKFAQQDEKFEDLAQNLRSLRTDTQKEIGMLAQDLRSFRADTQKEVGILAQDLQDFRTDTQARFARATSEVGQIIREVGEYFRGKIAAVQTKASRLQMISLDTAQQLKKSFAEQEEKLAQLEEEK